MSVYDSVEYQALEDRYFKLKRVLELIATHNPRGCRPSLANLRSEYVKGCCFECLQDTAREALEGGK